MDSSKSLSSIEMCYYRTGTGNFYIISWHGLPFLSIGKSCGICTRSSNNDDVTAEIYCDDVFLDLEETNNAQNSSSITRKRKKNVQR